MPRLKSWMIQKGNLPCSRAQVAALTVPPLDAHRLLPVLPRWLNCVGLQRMVHEEAIAVMSISSPLPNQPAFS
jgi:hypothetical protein